jgi:hypothetical protein
MSIYCVYLTIYKGNKLPHFYIGSTSVAKIQAGYHGSVSSKKFKMIWKQELKAHPELFLTKIISYHTDRDEATEKESAMQGHLRVHKNPMYINCRIAKQCKYANVTEYNRTRINPNLGNSLLNKGRVDSEYTKKKKSESGKKKVFSINHRKNLSTARQHIKLADTTKVKISQAQQGKARPKTTGAGNGRSKRILFHDKIYESQRQCSLQTGLSVYLIQKAAIFI